MIYFFQLSFPIREKNCTELASKTFIDFKCDEKQFAFILFLVYLFLLFDITCKRDHAFINKTFITSALRYKFFLLTLIKTTI
jgi:hypothetical protein